jgi:FkbM family methyltransferase
VLAAYDLLADEASRAEYVANIRWRIDPESRELPPPANHEIYFPPGLFAVRDDEVFVDCGGFDGDTLASLLRRKPSGSCQAIVFEPDPRNFSKLARFVESLPAGVTQAVEIHQAAVGSSASVIRLQTRSSTASSVSESGETEIPCLAIDETLGERIASFIKMDIEGAEPAAIEGAARQIRLHQPLLALSAYHSQEHLWQLPLQVHALHPDYRYFLRHYADEPVDALVVYAVPAGRLLAPAGRQSGGPDNPLAREAQA